MHKYTCSTCGKIYIRRSEISKGADPLCLDCLFEKSQLVMDHTLVEEREAMHKRIKQLEKRLDTIEKGTAPEPEEPRRPTMKELAKAYVDDYEAYNGGVGTSSAAATGAKMAHYIQSVIRRLNHEIHPDECVDKMVAFDILMKIIREDREYYKGENNDKT